MTTAADINPDGLPTADEAMRLIRGSLMGMRPGSATARRFWGAEVDDKGPQEGIISAVRTETGVAFEVSVDPIEIGARTSQVGTGGSAVPYEHVGEDQEPEQPGIVA